jgi:hypothetical protein
MRRAYVFLLVACFALTPTIAGQVSSGELLQMLNIHTWRIRVPSGVHEVWDIRALTKEQLHAQGNSPRGLTTRATYLLAFREVDEHKFEFTLPELKGASRGVQDLCKLFPAVRSSEDECARA